MKGYLVGRFESYFQKQNEQTKQGHGHGLGMVRSCSPAPRQWTSPSPSNMSARSARSDTSNRALENGYLTEITVREGQAVKKGDLMFKIVPTLDKAKPDAESANVIAPFDGILDRLHEQLGSLIKEGDILTTLSDNSVMWVYFNVPETQYLEYMANRKQHEEDKNRTRAGERQTSSRSPARSVRSRPNSTTRPGTSPSARIFRTRTACCVTVRPAPS